MSNYSLGRKLESDFEYNNCVKDADIYIRMGKVLYSQRFKRIPPETLFYSLCAIGPNMHNWSCSAYF